jgi:hypothetical protein
MVDEKLDVRELKLEMIRVHLSSDLNLPSICHHKGKVVISVD